MTKSLANTGMVHKLFLEGAEICLQNQHTLGIILCEGSQSFLQIVAMTDQKNDNMRAAEHCRKRYSRIGEVLTFSKFKIRCTLS